MIRRLLRDEDAVRAVVLKVVFALAVGGYGWLFFSKFEKEGFGGASMWVLLVVGPLIAVCVWANVRGENRRSAGRLAVAERLEAAADYPPLVNLDDRERFELLDALVHAAGFETVPPKWQSAIREAERNRDSGMLPPPPPPAPVLPQIGPIEAVFGEVSEEASRFWSKPHPRLLLAAPMAVVLVVGITGITAGVLLYRELGTLLMLVIIVGSLTLALVVAVWLSRRYEIPLESPPRPPPDPRNAPDRASFRGNNRGALIIALLVPLEVYVIVIPVLVFAGPHPKINARDAPVWLASAGIALALVVAAFVWMRRVRIDIDASGLSVINFWKTHVIPWESVRAIRMGGTRWGGPFFFALKMATAQTGAAGEAPDAPSGLRIFLDEGELDSRVSRSISVTATLWCDPQRNPRYQQALATLVKQVHAYGLTHEDPVTRREAEEHARREAEEEERQRAEREAATREQALETPQPGSDVLPRPRPGQRGPSRASVAKAARFTWRDEPRRVKVLMAGGPIVLAGLIAAAIALTGGGGSNSPAGRAASNSNLAGSKSQIVQCLHAAGYSTKPDSAPIYATWELEVNTTNNLYFIAFFPTANEAKSWAQADKPNYHQFGNITVGPPEKYFKPEQSKVESCVQ